MHQIVRLVTHKYEVGLTRFEQQNRHLTQIEVDEMLRLVRNIGAKISAYDAVPVRMRRESISEWISLDDWKSFQRELKKSHSTRSVRRYDRTPS